MAAKQATVTLKAVFLRRTVEGKTKYIRAPFDIEIRDYGNGDARGRQSYLALRVGDGHTPGRAQTFDQTDPGRGEQYDAIEYWDSYPAGWPRIGFQG